MSCFYTLRIILANNHTVASCMPDATMHFTRRVLGALSCLSSKVHLLTKFCSWFTRMLCKHFGRHAYDFSVKGVVIVLQGSLNERGSQVQNQVAMNQQLMKRKEDMEWQLMSALAQVWLLQY